MTKYQHFLFKELAPLYESKSYCVVTLNYTTGKFENQSWFYTENEARLDHHRRMFGNES